MDGQAPEDARERDSHLTGAMMDLWDIEWFTGDGGVLEAQQGLERESAERQAQTWLQDTPRSQVSLYRRRGERSVLVQILTANDGGRLLPGLA